VKIEKNNEQQTVSELLNYEVNNRTTTVLQFLRNIQVKKEGEEKRIATVQVLFDYNRILKKSRETLFFWGLLVLLLCFALVGALFLPISSVYTRLYEGMEEVARNRFGFELPSKTRDETGILFKTFNRMNRHLLADFKKGQEAHLESLQDEDPDKAGLSEHLLRKTEITCLCARIPDIQDIIEKNAPSAVDNYINGFIEPLEKKVQEYGGQIVKVLGDKVYTLFEGINSIDNSVRMALKVNQSWQIDNHERKVLDRRQRNYGIGLHSTEGIAGALSRMSSASYTFIGEAASAAERLCSCAQAEEILISSSMMDKTTGAYQHQLAKTLSAEDLTMKEDVISITPLPIDEMHTRSAMKSGAVDNEAGSEFMVGKAKPSFESSITDMLEETLISSPLDPLKTDGRSGAGMNDAMGDMGITGEQFGDVSDSLWEKFDSIKKDDKE
jgi:class 3 adenylate cyclase